MKNLNKKREPNFLWEALREALWEAKAPMGAQSGGPVVFTRPPRLLVTGLTGLTGLTFPSFGRSASPFLPSVGLTGLTGLTGLGGSSASGASIEHEASPLLVST